MTTWASGGGIKIERAAEHIRALDAEMRAFTTARFPFYVSTEIEAERLIRRARVLEALPLRWGAIAGDVLHNLRSSLDILWRNVWYPAAGGEEDHKLEFLIFESAAAMEKRFPRDRLPTNKRRKAAVELAYEIQPYQGGNALLWLLHQANAADKHRLLIPAHGQIITEFTTTVGVLTPTASGLQRNPHLAEHAGRIVTKREPKVVFPVVDGAEIFNAHIDDPSVLLPASADGAIVFGEGEGIKGLMISPTLHGIYHTVEAVVARYLSAGLLD